MKKMYWKTGNVSQTYEGTQDDLCKGVYYLTVASLVYFASTRLSN